MNSNMVLISEGEQTIFKGSFFTFKNKIKKIFFFIIKIIIFFVFISICCLILKLKLNIDHINNLSYLNKYLNQKIIDQLNFIEIKLQILEENQRILSNNRKIFTKYNNEFYYLMNSMDVLGYKKIRIGKKADGGYIILDDFRNIKIAYSFGIDSEISFEKELADRNIDIFMYDHTINKLPFENSKFHWKKIGLSGQNINDSNMKTLSELINENRHLEEDNMILKIDIESYEWEVFQYLNTSIFRQFKYIIGEFHISEINKYDYYNILKKILITHQIFHIHCNNCGGIIQLNGLKICSAFEISFIQKEGYNFTKDTNVYPIEGLDYKNCQEQEDYSYIINLFNKYEY